ncbi:type II toxin-antitoxin system YafQ family toxin [Neisseria cinerea]|uniref:type II toxin-antitoxin system YafQ family toxin n=1 Tax=Neisseria cinerea TaxID=483 RepID=UPI001F4771FD|nr:type II toxin-antitoxin system YafQ family toxin [Neisseria cinerea]
MSASSVLKSGFSCCTAIPVSATLCIAFRSLKNELVPANQFKRDAKKQWQILLGNDWITVAGCLMNGEPIPEKYKDHSLTGNYYGYRECHIRPDMLLIYRQDGDEICLLRLGISDKV